MTLEQAANRLSDRAELLWHQGMNFLLWSSLWEVVRWPTWLRRLWLLTLPVAVPLQIIGTIAKYLLALLWWVGGVTVALFVGIIILLPIVAFQGARWVWQAR